MKLSKLKQLIKENYRFVVENQEADNQEIESAIQDLEDDGLYNDKDVVAEADEIVGRWKKIQESKKKKTQL